MANINVNGGHSSHARGASGHLDEYNEDRAIIARLIPELERRGHYVTDGSSEEWTVNDDLRYQVTIANASGAEVALSVHLNAGGGTGVECFYYGGDATGYAYAADMSARVANALGLRDRGAKDGRNLYWICNTDMTAILLEVCFVDSWDDMLEYNGCSWDALIGAIADALVGESVAPPVPVEPPKPTVWDGPGIEYAGPDRYATCRIIADAADRKTGHLMSAKGSNYADALAGLWYAGTLGARVEYVEGPLTIDGYGVSCANRYKTQEAFDAMAIGMDADIKDTCFVVLADGFADGMAVSGYSYSHGIPILFYADSNEFRKQLSRFSYIIAIGNDVPAIGEHERIAGSNRSETAIKVAERFAASWQCVNICSGYSFADGIAIAQRQGDTPLLFAEGQATIDALISHKSEINEIVFVGGLDAVSYDRRTEICVAAGLSD
ncbi:MAG: cell wall-binding repeat-containing protein [Raoultibacter sp.]